MEFYVKIRANNAAFEDDLNGELARCLEAVKRQVANGSDQGSILDTNGNKVGSFAIGRYF